MQPKKFWIVKDLYQDGESENPSSFLPSHSFHRAFIISIKFDHLKSGYNNTNKWFIRNACLIPSPTPSISGCNHHANKIFMHSVPVSTWISTAKFQQLHLILVTWVNKVDKEKWWQDHLKRKQHCQQRAVIVLLVLRTKLLCIKHQEHNRQRKQVDQVTPQTKLPLQCTNIPDAARAAAREQELKADLEWQAKNVEWRCLHEMTTLEWLPVW
jgi:hypothetical protein